MDNIEEIKEYVSWENPYISNKSRMYILENIDIFTPEKLFLIKKNIKRLKKISTNISQTITKQDGYNLWFIIKKNQIQSYLKKEQMEKKEDEWYFTELL